MPRGSQRANGPPSEEQEESTRVLVWTGNLQKESSSCIKSVTSIVRSAAFRKLSTSRETIICANGLIPTEEKYFKPWGTIIIYMTTRKCDPKIARKYRAEPLITVLRMVGQVECAPHVEYESRTRVRNDIAS